MSFTITCDECGSSNCRIETEEGMYTEVKIICNDCGHEE